MNEGPANRADQTQADRSRSICLHKIGRRFVSASGMSVTALHQISAQIDAGELVSVVGRSGSGKTTLLHILGTLDRPSSGTLELFGDEVSQLTDDRLAAIRSWSIGFVFQSFCLMDGLTAEENVASALLYRGTSPQERRDLALNALARVALTERAHHLPSELSGGERQRVAIARAIVGDRRLVIADEPTGNLDSTTAVEIWSILRDIADRGVAVVVATHDPSAATMSDRVLRMHDGSVSAE